MPNVLIRGVPTDVAEILKRRAAGNRRSLQQEMLAILEQAAEQPSAMTAAEVATTVRERFAEKGIGFGESAPLIRADREW